MTVKFKSLALVFFSILAGCNEVTVTNFRNPTIDTFYTSYSLDSDNLKKYILNGVLVTPYFSPGYNYESYDLVLSGFSMDQGNRIVINKIVINGIGVLYDGEEVVEPRKPYKTLFRDDRIIVKNMVTNDILKVAGGKKAFIVNVDVSNQGKKQTLSYPFFVKKKTIAAPVR